MTNTMSKLSFSIKLCCLFFILAQWSIPWLWLNFQSSSFSTDDSKMVKAVLSHCAQSRVEPSQPTEWPSNDRDLQYLGPSHNHSSQPIFCFSRQIAACTSWCTNYDPQICRAWTVMSTVRCMNLDCMVATSASPFSNLNESAAKHRSSLKLRRKCSATPMLGRFEAWNGTHWSNYICTEKTYLAYSVNISGNSGLFFFPLAFIFMFKSSEKDWPNASCQLMLRTKMEAGCLLGA